MQTTSHKTLSHPLELPPDGTSMHDRVQIALAIAEPDILKSLLLNCMPALAVWEQVGAISSAIGVPVESRKAVDGVISYETIHCVLAESPQEIERQVFAQTDPKLVRREWLKLTRCESETYTLGRGLALAEAIALLEYAGFSSTEVADILNIPTEAWHKSWWYTRDDVGALTVPFLRLIRTLRYPDGTFTLQYKDYFSQNKPTCFTRQRHQVLVEIKTASHSFHKTLERINIARAQLGIERAILICDRLSPLEARGFMSQQISVYTAEELVLYTHSDCTLCVNQDCPLNGNETSPVVMCRRFCVAE